MLNRVTTYEVWSLDEYAPPSGAGIWSQQLGYGTPPPQRIWNPRPFVWNEQRMAA
jgi:hypothetical protein